jgi:dipeptidyl aminopeptidase/acylaminoacyl peptidase
MRAGRARRTLFAALACLAAFALIQMARAFVAARRPFLPRHVEVGPPPAELRGAVSVEFPSRDGDALRGWYVPPRDEGTVLLLHGTESDRRELLPEARILSGHGFGVLMFDWPGNGESGGRPRWGRPERDALLGAVDWQAHETSVQRVGALGFSIGANILLVTAADEPRLAALAVEGAQLDVVEQTDYEFRRWGALTQWPARGALLASGFDPQGPQALDAVGRLAGRPLLVIVGEKDTTVPPSSSERLFDRAQPPRELWRVAGAVHGDYARVAGAEYERRLVDFFGRALR